MLEEHVYDLLPGYALGSLDEQELLQVARHLPNCAACRGDLSAYLATVDQLAYAAPLKTPAPALRSKVLGRVEQRARQLQPAPERTGFWDSLKALFTRQAGFALGAVALLLVIVLGVSNLVLWRQVNDLRAQVPAKNAQLVHLSGTTSAPEARGYVMVFKNETYGTLIVEDAPALKPGYQYQLWLIRDGKRTSGGVFSVSEQGYGTLEINSNQPLDGFSSFGITIEPAGGSPGPTGQKVLGGNF